MSIVSNVNSIAPFDPTGGAGAQYRSGITLQPNTGVDPLARTSLRLTARFFSNGIEAICALIFVLRVASCLAVIVPTGKPVVVSGTLIV